MDWRYLVLALVLVALGGLWLWLRSRRRPRFPVPEEFEVPAPGGHLRGVRYRNPGFPPVILIHGYTGNSRNWRELGYQLHRDGFDVWMPNLRGHGKGSHRSTAFGGQGAYGFDEIATCDLPALVELVAGQTGRPMSLVCHSMGGVAARAYLSGVRRRSDGKLEFCEDTAKRRRSLVEGLVLMGSPPHFRALPTAYRTFMRQPEGWVAWIQSMLPIPDGERAPTLPDKPEPLWKKPFQLASRYVALARSPALLKGIIEISNFKASQDELGRFLRKGISKVHGDLVLDIHRWVREGDATSRDGLNYSESRPLGVPVLFVAGEWDQLAPWTEVFSAAERQRRWDRAGKVCVNATSHVDLIAGERAARLLGSVLAEFLRRPRSWPDSERRIGI